MSYMTSMTSYFPYIIKYYSSLVVNISIQRLRYYLGLNTVCVTVAEMSNLKSFEIQAKNQQKDRMYRMPKTDWRFSPKLFPFTLYLCRDMKIMTCSVLYKVSIGWVQCYNDNVPVIRHKHKCISDLTVTQMASVQESCAIAKTTARCALYIGYSTIILLTPTFTTLCGFDSERI